MPGHDLAATVNAVVDLVGDLAFLPELPERGVGADLVGRGVALLDGLGADLQPTGWRLLDRAGREQRRARSLLAQDLDVLEEHLQGFTGTLKVQVAGPWTLAATLERPRGGKALADHGARRDLAASLASGVAEHVADVRRRVEGSDVVVQVDEPALRAVLDSGVPTASGLGRYRRIDVPEADAALRTVVGAVVAAGASPVAHCCAAPFPTTLLAGAGFAALSFDLALVGTSDVEALATAFAAGTDLWPGIADEPVGDQRRRLERFADVLGADEAAFEERTVLTPPCGLVDRSPQQARAVLGRLADTARG